MKRFFAFAALALLGANSLRAADSAIMAPLRTQYEITSSLMYNMVEAIPEDKYDFKPVPEVRSFREQMQHVIAGAQGCQRLAQQRQSGQGQIALQLEQLLGPGVEGAERSVRSQHQPALGQGLEPLAQLLRRQRPGLSGGWRPPVSDRKSTRLNSSHT